MTKNPVISTRSKHITLDFVLHLRIGESQKLRITHVSSIDQLTNVFTKQLHKHRFAYIRHKLQVRFDHELAKGDNEYVLYKNSLYLSIIII